MGDANSKFFHAMVRQKRVKLHIHRIRNPAGGWLEDNSEIENLAVDLFSNMLSQQDGLNLVDYELLEVIPRILSPSR